MRHPNSGYTLLEIRYYGNARSFGKAQGSCSITIFSATTKGKHSTKNTPQVVSILYKNPLSIPKKSYILEQRHCKNSTRKKQTTPFYLLHHKHYDIYAEHYTKKNTEKKNTHSSKMPSKLG